MPIIERANRIAVKSIKFLGKKPGPERRKSKSKDRQQAPRSAYNSENEDADDTSYDSSVRQYSCSDVSYKKKRPMQIMATTAKLGVAPQIRLNNKSLSMSDLTAPVHPADDFPQQMSEDRFSEDNYSSTNDSSSFPISPVNQFTKNRLPRQHSFDDSDVSTPSTSVRDNRSRMRNRKAPIPPILVSNCSLDQTDDDSRITRSIRDTSSISSPRRTPSEKRMVLPREGFFWQILLYLRLARALPVRTVNGRIDPYVKVKYRGKSFLRTPIVPNNRNPVWDEKFYLPINNLEYPVELRVYHRDAFKKDDYLGRVLVHPTKLAFGVDQEFTLQLFDETGRSVRPYLGELNFWMTLNEVSETSIPNDRRRAMLKQIKEDRQATGHMGSLMTRVPSDLKYATDRYLMSLQWCESVSNVSREVPSDYAITSMDEYEPDEDEWLLPSAATFYQPQWPLNFYNGTKIEFYTAHVPDKTKQISFSQLSSMKHGRTEVRLERLYSRAHLLVNLIRGDDIGVMVHNQHNQHATIENGNAAGTSLNATTGAIVPAGAASVNSGMRRSSSNPTKIFENRSVERAVVGRPISHRHGTLPSPIAELSIGKSTHKSRLISNSHSPYWHEEFEFRLKLGEKAVLNVQIIDHAIASLPVIFRGHLDFERQVPDWTGCFTLKNNLDGYLGHVVLLVTLTGLTSCSESSPVSSSSVQLDQSFEQSPSPVHFHLETPLPLPPLVLPSKELLSQVETHYSIYKTVESRRDVGWFYLVVRCAKDLAPKERNGRSDPFCVIRLVNRCVHTSTVYKTINPTWNEAFVFPIADVYDLLDITVLDEDKKGAEFLGKLCFPVIQLPHRKAKWFTLKDKKLMKRARGSILLESYVIYNPVRAAFRAIYPKEHPWVWTQTRVHLRDLIRKYVPQLQQKIDRIAPYGLYMAKGQQVFMKLYKWENPVYSSLALVGMWFGILFVQPYMVMAGMMIGFAGCWLLSMGFLQSHFHRRPSNIPTAQESDEDDYEDISCNEQDVLDAYSESESDEQEQKTKGRHAGHLKHIAKAKEQITQQLPWGKKKPLKMKLAKTRQVLGTLQTVMESFASLLEQVDSLIKWQVPWLSMLFFVFLLLATLLTYFVPLRYIVVFFVTKRFTRRLRNAKAFDASPMSIISRVPNKQQRIIFRELRPKPVHTNTT